jgi:hypothetical protein
MLFFPVFVYTEPRSAKLQPRPVPPAWRGDHPTRRGSADSDRGGQVALSRRVLSSIPVIQPLCFQTLTHSSAQWTLATPFLSSASRLFLLQWECTPLPSGMSSHKESLGNWRFDPLNSSSFHFSPFTGHGLRGTALQPLRAPRTQNEFTNCAFSCPERRGGVPATPLPRENSRGAHFMGGV